MTLLIYVLCLTPLAGLAVQATVKRNRVVRAIEASRKADEAWWQSYYGKRAQNSLERV